jgi:hypothetical protein
VTNVDKITGRPSQYLADTGVPLLAGGLIFALLGSSVLIQQVLPKGFIAQETPRWIAICCAGAVLLGARAVKQRIVFPRGGYVQPLPHPALRFMRVASFAAVVAVAIFAMTWPGRLPHAESRLIEPGFAMAFAIICMATGWQQKSRSIMGFGAYLVGLAPLLWILESGYERGSWFEVGVGAPLAVAGEIRLRSFLKANPKPVETATNE